MPETMDPEVSAKALNVKGKDVLKAVRFQDSCKFGILLRD
jgi:hypothetical protein